MSQLEILQAIEVEGLYCFLRRIVEALKMESDSGQAQIIAEEIDEILNWNWEPNNRLNRK